jgi:dienelactone hydrolase
MHRFSNRAHLQQIAASLRPELSFPAGQPEAWPEWRRALRQKINDLLGGVPPWRDALPPEVLERQEDDGYIRERLVITSRDGVEIPAFLLTPSAPVPEGGRRRAVLCLHGHGRGKSDLVGDPGSGSPQEVEARLAHIAEANYDYAIQYARLGFVTLAPDARGFGERAESLENLESECYVPGVVSLFLGIPIAGQRLCDDLSCLDYLCSLPGVDPARIGCAGLSEGGKRTMYLAAMDDRIRAAVISGYFTTITGWIRAWTTMENHDICNYVPGLLRYADYPDLIALIAPRPLLIEYGTEDPLFDRPAVDEAVARAVRDYTAQGATDHFDTDIFAGGHQWRGKKSLAWLDRWL